MERVVEVGAGVDREVDVVGVVCAALSRTHTHTHTHTYKHTRVAHTHTAYVSMQVLKSAPSKSIQMQMHIKRHQEHRDGLYISIRQHASAYVSIRQHTSAYVSIRLYRHQEHRDGVSYEALSY